MSDIRQARSRADVRRQVQTARRRITCHFLAVVVRDDSGEMGVTEQVEASVVNVVWGARSRHAWKGQKLTDL